MAKPKRSKPAPKPAPKKPAPKPPQRAAMYVPRHGWLPLHVTEVTHGISIVSSESESRYNRALYVAAKTAGSFGMSLAFYSYKEWDTFNRAMRHYGYHLARGEAGVGVCRVVIPALKDRGGKMFDRPGIPRSPIPFGDSFDAVVRRASLSFFGSSDPYSPVGVRNTALVSNVIGAEYLQAIKKDPQAAYYYPVGTQLAGTTSGTDTLYDSVRTSEGLDEGSEAPRPNFTPGGRRGVQEF